MKNLLLILITILTLTACEKTIELDPRQTPERVIIEGLITDHLAQHEIRITKTQPFGGSGQAPLVSGAVVQVGDDAGNLYPFHEASPGIYRAQEAFAGAVGRTYTMRVEVDGKEYTAAEELRPIALLGQLEYRIDEEEKADPEDEGRYYEVLVYLNEPQDREDFYLARFYRNGELLNDSGSRVYVFDDRAIGAEIQALPIDFYYAWNDTVRVEVYSLTRRAYNFYVDLSGNINNDGGMFSGQPANVSTNISGGALGYFQVSGLTVGELNVN